MELNDFLRKVEEIRKEQPRYRLGGSGQDGTCDCIGLIIGAIRRGGGVWNGTHGSNYAARYEMATFGPITVADMEVGMVVYKGYQKGDAGYSLPAKYNSSGDLTDYYHVGVVTSVQPLIITHCTTPTVKQDTKQGKWLYGGRLKKIDYEGGIIMEKAIVRTSGGTLNLRTQPSKSSARLAEIPNGTVVDLHDSDGSWWRISYKGKTGYADSTYLVRQGAEAEMAEGISAEMKDGMVTITMPLAWAKDVLTLMDAAREKLTSVIGRD